MVEGVATAAEGKLVLSEPFISFYEREKGTFVGRLMQAEAVTVSVMTRLLALAEDEGQGSCGCEDVTDQVQTWLGESLQS